MRVKIIVAAVAATLVHWAPTALARQSVVLPYIFGVSPDDAVGQATGIDTSVGALLTINPNININTLNDVGGGITTLQLNTASILFLGNSTVTGFIGSEPNRFLNITAGANATTLNFNGDVVTTSFNLSGTGTANFNGNLNFATTAASTNFDADGFINIGANRVFNSAITTNTANTGTLTLNSLSSVIGAIGGANGLKQINVVGGNAAVTGAVQARGFSLGLNTLSITGQLTTNPAGLISTTLASDSVYGRIIVDGNAAIDAGGITVLPTVTGVLTNGTTFNIVAAGAGTTGATVNVINNNPRFTFSGLPTQAGNVDIQLTGVAPLATLVTAPTALAVAPVLDINAPVGTDFRFIQDAIAILPTTTAINNALTQLAPGNTQLAAPWVAGQATRMFEDQLLARMDKVQAECCDAACGPNDSPKKPQNTHECGDNHQLNNMWGKLTGNVGNQDGQNSMNGYETQAVGLVLGYDVPLGLHSRVGLGGGYTNTSISDDSSPARTKVDSYQVSGYFEYAPQPWFLQAALTAGVDKYDGNRFITFPGINRRVNADYSGRQYTGLVALGKHFYVNETVVTPLVSLQASRISVDRYNEKGGGDANLRVDSQDYDFVQSSLGVKVERMIKTTTGVVSPELHARWLHDFNSTTMHQTVAFAGGGSAFNVQGIKQDRDLYNVGAGFTMLYCNCENNAWSVKGLYDYRWNDSDYTSHQVSLIANLRF